MCPIAGVRQGTLPKNHNPLALVIDACFGKLRLGDEVQKTRLVGFRDGQPKGPAIGADRIVDCAEIVKRHVRCGKA